MTSRFFECLSRRARLDISRAVDHQTMQGSICWTFHVCETAPFAVALVSFVVPLSFTWLTAHVQTWPLEEIFSMFAVGVQLCQCLLSKCVGVFSVGDSLMHIIEIDHLLLPLTNEFPVCLLRRF